MPPPKADLLSRADDATRGGARVVKLQNLFNTRRALSAASFCMPYIHRALAPLLLAFACSAGAQTVPQDEAGFTEHVAKLLRLETGGETVFVKGPLTLGVGELQANLDRVFAFCRNNATECPNEIGRYVRGAAQAYKERNAAIGRSEVRIVLRTSQYVKSRQPGVGGSAPPPVQPRPFVEGLVALPVLDAPSTIRMLGEKDNARLGLSLQEVFDLGLANLRKTQKPVMELVQAAGPGQIGQLVGDSFYPSRLLLLDTWAPLAKAQGGALIVAIPATDAVLYVGEDTPEAIDALQTLSNDVLSKVPNPLSNVLLRWRETGWDVVKK